MGGYLNNVSATRQVRGEGETDSKGEHNQTKRTRRAKEVGAEGEPERSNPKPCKTL